MRLETLLPLGKLDPGLRAPEVGLDLSAVGADARLLEELGYDGVVIEETKQDPYIVMALAAQATQRLGVGTAIAMAFPRSPTITALSAWTLQKLSRGRFTLGLGPQVRAHIERRYGVAWSAPGPWMREYVAVVRAIWQRWQTNEPLNLKGPHYTINLMPPLFDPGPIEHPDIPIHLAAVNTHMCRVAGEVADGVRPPRLAFGMAAPPRGLLLGGFTRSSASCRTYARSWLTAPMAYLRTSVTTRFGERLGFLGRGTATEAMYSLTLRR